VTAEKAFTLLAGHDVAVTSLGVLRGYATRHGNGPLPTEDAELTALFPDDTNPTNAWQGTLRVGHLDLVLLRYALAVAGRVDALAVTCLDRMAAFDGWQVAARYEGDWEPEARNREDLVYRESVTRRLQAARPVYQTWAGSAEAHAAEIARFLRKPVAVTSWGKSAQEKCNSG
jgi:adenylosuccinate synthase